MEISCKFDLGLLPTVIMDERLFINRKKDDEDE